MPDDQLVYLDTLMCTHGVKPSWQIKMVPQPGPRASFQPTFFNYTPPPALEKPLESGLQPVVHQFHLENTQPPLSKLPRKTKTTHHHVDGYEQPCQELDAQGPQHEQHLLSQPQVSPNPTTIASAPPNLTPSRRALSALSNSPHQPASPSSISLKHCDISPLSLAPLPKTAKHNLPAHDLPSADTTVTKDDPLPTRARSVSLTSEDGLWITGHAPKDVYEREWHRLAVQGMEARHDDAGCYPYVVTDRTLVVRARAVRARVAEMGRE